MGRRGIAPLASPGHGVPLGMDIQRQGMTVALADRNRSPARDDKAEPRHALDAFVGRGHHRLIADAGHVHRPEGRHAVDQQLSAPHRDRCRNLGQGVQDAAGGFAVDGDDMGDRGVGVQRGPDLVTARRHVVALVDHCVGAPHHPQGLGGPQAVSAVGQDQDLAVPWHKGAQHRLDAVTARSLHRHADKVVAAPGQGQQLVADRPGHDAKIAVP